MISLLICFRDLFIRSKLQNVVSSEEWWILLFLIETCKSFIKITNNSGPKTEPWGTPYMTFSEVEFASFILVYCFLLTKNDLN